MAITCTIMRSDGAERYSNVESVTLPTPSGIVQVLAHHVEAIVEVVRGKITCAYASGEVRRVDVDRGICHITGTDVTIIV